MQIYDALIIGCGYASVGFARKNKNVIICEEHQICDTGFYLPARCYEHFPYRAKTAYKRQKHTLIGNALHRTHRQ